MKKVFMGILSLVSVSAFATNPLQIASNLAAQGFSCQNEKIVLEHLLSESPLNSTVINAAQKIYNSCVNEVGEIVFKNPGKPTKVFELLQTKKLVCFRQIEKIEELLSEVELNYLEIENARKSFESCRSGALKVITNK